jgi:N-acylneuraminate cytidylyltransferase
MCTKHAKTSLREKTSAISYPESKSTIAIIPARGGSERVPHKNILPFADKPLIAHTIEHAQKSQLIGRIIVSTDSTEIAEVSKQYNAEVLNRPKKLSINTIPTVPVLLHVIDYLERKEGFYPNIIVLLQCTSPIRKKDDIDNAIKTLIHTDADCVFSACHFKDYIWQMNEDVVESVNFDYWRQWWRGQDFPLQYRANGSIFVYKNEALKKMNSVFGGKLAIYQMDYLSSFQIDTSEDFFLCECIARNL